MGVASLVVRIVKNAVEGKYGLRRGIDLGIHKPPPWKLGQRSLYRAIKTSNDPRIQAMQVKGTYDMEQAITELPSTPHVSAWWLDKAISTTHKTSSIRTIMAYLKSACASNLNPYDKAHLWMACLEKLKYFGVVRGFFE